MEIEYNMNQNKAGIKHLAEICVNKGIEHIIISPGSRNAPIILAFLQHKKMNCLSIADERSAGFFGLGMAQQIGKPVIIACTSGTAALNYAPAIAEAYYQKIPLLILTADRPVEWIDMADSQTIRQKDIYRNYIRKSVELPQQINTKDDLWYADRLINEAISACMYPCPGPVHINLPFTEPLYEGFDKKLTKIKIINTVVSSQIISETQLLELANQWNNSKRKLIVTGILSKNQDLNQILTKLANDPSVAIMTETTSNLFSKSFYPCVDRIISTISKEETKIFYPDLLITFGNQIISKKIKAFLRELTPNAHWHIDHTDLYLDTFQSLTHNIPLKPLDFLTLLQKHIIPAQSPYAKIWNERDNLTNQKHEEYLTHCNYSDLKVFEKILTAIPENNHLQMGNSTAVRYVQLFRNRQDIKYFSNRGTSGIDGCLSTAVGAAYASKHPTTLIIGDLSFFHDSNGLWNNYLSKQLKIIIVNNGGGGIFRFIEGPDSTQALDYFETPHQMNAEHIAKTFGINYFKANSIKSLDHALNSFYNESNKKTAILEIFTPREKNAVILKDYFRYLKK